MAAVRRIADAFGLLKQWPEPPDFLDAERVFGRLRTAAPDPSGEPVGFGGTLRRGDLTHLGDLFIDPAHQPGGAGRALLDQLFDGTGARVTFASGDPRAVPSYLRY